MVGRKQRTEKSRQRDKKLREYVRLISHFARRTRALDMYQQTGSRPVDGNNQFGPLNRIDFSRLPDERKDQQDVHESAHCAPSDKPLELFALANRNLRPHRSGGCDLKSAAICITAKMEGKTHHGNSRSDYPFASTCGESEARLLSSLDPACISSTIIANRWFRVSTLTPARVM